MDTCLAPSCTNQPHAKGICRAHYMRIWRHGSFDLPVRIKPTLAERLAKYVSVDQATGCWLWTAALSTSGYGVLAVNRTRFYAHRLSYEVHVGRIPDDLTIDHLCRTRRCVNPAHLEAVTMSENIRRAATKTHCDRGHVLSQHAYVRPDGQGRFCKTCSSNRSAARQKATRAATRALPCEGCGNAVGGKKARRFCESCSKTRSKAYKLDWQRSARRTSNELGEVHH